MDITAVVHNRGARPLRNVPVRFTQAGTKAVLGQVVVPGIKARGSAVARLKWKARIIGDRSPRAKGGPKRYVHTDIEAAVGDETPHGPWSGVARTSLTVRPRPMPRFCDGLIWSSDARYADEKRLVLRAALVNLLNDPQAKLLYVPDSPLSATLTPYLGHPDKGGVALAPPRRLADIQATEFGVAEWELSTEALPKRFTVWVEVLCDETVSPGSEIIDSTILA